MISMSKAYSIRQLRMEGDSIAEISRKLEVSRDTVYKYLAMDDLSQRPPAPRAKASVLDRYRPLIESWLDEDERNWRKRATPPAASGPAARRGPAPTSPSRPVRNYVRRSSSSAAASREQYLDLDWEPGDAQADFGEADFYVGGVRTRMSFFVMTFPYSNVGIAQVFPGENAECVCQALRNMFEHVAGVPRRIVFDSAAGVAAASATPSAPPRCSRPSPPTTGSPTRSAIPYSGHEKGSVEKKVGYIRDNLFVPLPQVASADAFNARLARPVHGAVRQGPLDQGRERAAAVRRGPVRDDGAAAGAVLRRALRGPQGR